MLGLSLCAIVGKHVLCHEEFKNWLVHIFSGILNHKHYQEKGDIVVIGRRNVPPFPCYKVIKDGVAVHIVKFFHFIEEPHLAHFNLDDIGRTVVKSKDPRSCKVERPIIKYLRNTGHMHIYLFMEGCIDPLEQYLVSAESDTESKTRHSSRTCNKLKHFYKVSSDDLEKLAATEAEAGNVGVMGPPTSTLIQRRQTRTATTTHLEEGPVTQEPISENAIPFSNQHGKPLNATSPTAALGAPPPEPPAFYVPRSELEMKEQNAPVDIPTSADESVANVVNENQNLGFTNILVSIDGSGKLRHYQPLLCEDGHLAATKITMIPEHLQQGNALPSNPSDDVKVKGLTNIM